MMKVVRNTALAMSLTAAACAGGGEKMPTELSGRLEQIELETGLPGLSDLSSHPYEQYGESPDGRTHLATVGKVESGVPIPPEVLELAQTSFRLLAGSEKLPLPVFDADGNQHTLELELTGRDSEQYVLTVDGDLNLDGSTAWESGIDFTNFQGEPTVTLLTTDPDGRLTAETAYAALCVADLQVDPANEAALGIPEGEADMVAAQVLCQTLGSALLATTFGVPYETYVEDETAYIVDTPWFGTGQPEDPDSFAGRFGIVSRNIYEALETGRPVSDLTDAVTVPELPADAPVIEGDNTF